MYGENGWCRASTVTLTLHCLCLTWSRGAMGEKRRRACRIYVEPTLYTSSPAVRCCGRITPAPCAPLCPPVPPVHAIIQASPAVSWSRAAVRYCWGASLPPFPAISWSNPAFFRIKTRLILVKPRLFLVDPRPFLVDPTCPNSLPLPFLWLGAAVGIGSGCVGW